LIEKKRKGKLWKEWWKGKKETKKVSWLRKRWEMNEEFLNSSKSNTKAHPPVLIIIFVFLEFERLCSHFHVCFLLLFLVGKHLYVYFAASLTSNFLLIIFYFFRAHLKNKDTYFHLLLLSFNYIFIFKKIIKKLIK
jgi:hypothetical protein